MRDSFPCRRPAQLTPHYPLSENLRYAEIPEERSRQPKFERPIVFWQKGPPQHCIAGKHDDLPYGADNHDERARNRNREARSACLSTRLVMI